MSQDTVRRRDFLRLLGMTAGGLTLSLRLPMLSPDHAEAAPTTSLGAQLIGKLEGPEVITDPARFPKTYKEAPQLGELARTGKLPLVKDRIGEDPLVIKPLHGIGKYGGTWRRAFTGPGDWPNGYRTVSGPDNLLFWDYSVTKVVPNVAKRWEVSDGARTVTIFLRRGMKWSDGQPFTADDIMFWFEDMHQNKELVPTPAVEMSINNKPGVIEKVDAYTVRYKFQDPYYLFPQVLAGVGPLGGHAEIGLNAMGGFAPTHYLKQFHPKYTPREDLDRKVKEAQVDNWVALFKLKNNWYLNPELPTLAPWKTVTPINQPVWTLERNPYSIWVDIEGNQLPYIDKVVMTLAQNLEVVSLRAIAGEYDLQERHITLPRLPVLLQNEKKGGYKLYLDPAANGSDMVIKFNLSYEEDPELGKWFNTTDFRRALSLGINRDQANEAFWLGTGTPGSPVPAENTKYNPGPAYRKLWSTYEPEKANAMLDKLGLNKKDGEGYRLRTDGKGRLRIELMTVGGGVVSYTDIGEMIRQQWKNIGIDLNVREVERSLSLTLSGANKQQLAAWANDGSEDLFAFPDHVFPFSHANVATQGPLYVDWFQSGGTKGKEPPAPLRRIMEMWKKGFGVPDAERVRLGKEIWKINAEEVYSIGIVGLSAAFMGIRIAKVNMGNVPSRQYNSTAYKTPNPSRPVTFFWKT